MIRIKFYNNDTTKNRIYSNNYVAININNLPTE